MKDSSTFAPIINTDNEVSQRSKSGVEKLRPFVESENICQLLKEEELDQIYQDCSQEYTSAESDMAECIEVWKKDIDLVQMESERDLPFEGASDVVYPLASNAALNAGAKAFNAFFPDKDVYKGSICGEDNGIAETEDGEEQVDPQTNKPIMINVGVKAQAAKRTALAMNYQLKKLIPNWKAETLQLLYGVFNLGTMYRREYYDKVKRKHCSELLFPNRVFLRKNTKSLEEDCYSLPFTLEPREIQANINRGLFINYDYDTIASTDTTDTNSLNSEEDNTTSPAPKPTYDFVEQHSWIDLDEDGIEEPYSITFDVSNQKVVRIVADYEMDGIAEQDGYIYDIKRIVDIVDYRAIPSFDGTFWGLSLPFFLDNINAAINTTINQSLDTNNLKLKGGGFMANDLNIRGGALTLKLGEYKKINAMGATKIADKFYTPPLADLSPVTLALLNRMIESGEKIGLVTDALTGNIKANMAPTTFLGLTENAVAIESSMLKLINESFVKEAQIRRKINSKYYDEELYYRIVQEKPQDVSPEEDFLNDQVEIVLLIDSSSITQGQKMARAELYTSLKQDPFYDPMEIRKMFNEAVGMPELNDIMAPPPPSPQADIILAQAENKKADAKILDSQANSIKTAADIQEKGDKSALMEADIKVKESTALNNVVNAFAKQDEVDIKRAETVTDNLYKQQDIKIRQEQNDTNDRQKED